MRWFIISLVLFVGCEAKQGVSDPTGPVDVYAAPPADCSHPPARSLQQLAPHEHASDFEFGPCGDLFWRTDRSLWHAPPSLDSFRLLTDRLRRDSPSVTLTEDGTGVAYTTDDQLCLRLIADDAPTCMDTVVFPAYAGVGATAAGPFAWLSTNREVAVIGPGDATRRIARANTEMFADIGAGPQHNLLAINDGLAAPSRDARVAIYDLSLPGELSPQRVLHYPWLGRGATSDYNMHALRADGRVLIVRHHLTTDEVQDGQTYDMPHVAISLVDVASDEILSQFFLKLDPVRPQGGWWMKDDTGTHLVFALRDGGAMYLDPAGIVTRIDDVLPLSLSSDGRLLTAQDGEQRVQIELATGSRTALEPAPEMVEYEVSPNGGAAAYIEQIHEEDDRLWRALPNAPSVRLTSVQVGTKLHAIDDEGHLLYGVNDRNGAHHLQPLEGAAIPLTGLTHLYNMQPIPGGFLGENGRETRHLLTINTAGEITTILERECAQTTLSPDRRHFVTVVAGDLDAEESQPAHTVFAGAVPQP